MTGLTEERLWSLRVGLVDSGHAARRSRTQMRCTSTVPCGQEPYASAVDEVCQAIGDRGPCI